jgi:hypothetical protein
MENLKANLKNLSKNKIYLILIGLAVILLATVLIYAYVDRPELIRWDNCDGCYAVCKAIGTRSEGWYVSGNCDSGLNLIKYDNCGEKGCYSDSDCYGIIIPIGKEAYTVETTFDVVPMMQKSLIDGHHAQVEKISNSELRITVEGKEIEFIKQYEWVKNITKQSSQFCEFPEGECKGPGKCVDKLVNGGCATVWTPICGCDGKTYSNDCFRNMAGVSKKHDGECKQEKQTCDEKCKSLNYKSGICRMSCETWNNEVNMGYTSDCNPPCPPGMFCAAVMYDCCCQKENQEDCAKEGEQVNRNPLMGSTDKQCCPGLVENRVSRSYSICVKPIEDCAKEGEKNYFGKPSCCEGLTQISNFAIAESYPIQCIAPADGSGFCTKCGDGICKSPENKCNCPEDCKEETKPITVISPNGGEKWEIGGTYDITWEFSNTVENVVIDLYDCNSLPCESTAISPGISATQGKYSWNITVYDPGDKYKIQVTSIELGQFGGVTRKNISDQSDNYFSIVTSDNLVELEGKIMVIAEGSMSESWGIEVEQGPAGYIGETIGFCGDLTVLGLDIELFRNKRISVSIEPRINCFSLYQKTGRVLKWEECEDEDCMPEGSSVDTSGMQKCCAGLKAISCARPNSQGECHNEDFNCDSFPCANCGNGICGLGENKCNCPEDCKEEEILSADLNCDGKVNLTDSAILLSFWNKDPSGATSCKNPDINQDGKVNLADFSVMMSQWTTLL